MILTCLTCGKSFEAKRSDAKYCGKKCRQNHSLRIKRGSFATKICQVCGKEFKGPNHELYCSDNCKEWALQLYRDRGNDNRYDYLDSVSLGDEEDYLD